MPTDRQDSADDSIVTGSGRLPEPARAPAQRSLAEEEILQQPTLSEEELERRQAAIGTVRKPAGPNRDETARSAENERPSDVPETSVTPGGNE